MRSQRPYRVFIHLLSQEGPILLKLCVLPPEKRHSYFHVQCKTLCLPKYLEMRVGNDVTEYQKVEVNKMYSWAINHEHHELLGNIIFYPSSNSF